MANLDTQFRAFSILAIAVCLPLGCSDEAAQAEEETAVIEVQALDMDGDGINDAFDLCPRVPDPDQLDADNDGIGDLCDPDDDGDGVLDEADSCPDVPDPMRLDTDGDGIGDACDVDDDNDGVPDEEDQCPLDAEFAFGDLDGDSVGDFCDPDKDGDGVNDGLDNCPDASNADQADADRDGIGDLCDDDADGDDIPNGDDNCRLVANPAQLNSDDDLIGDVCDFDRDNDMVDNVVDNCPDTSNAGQADRDADGLGDPCDTCPLDAEDDVDGDGLCGSQDNCRDVANPDQVDSDGDGRGDACDPCEEDPLDDADGDGFCGTVDNCPNIENPLQEDSDGDGIGDACDVCYLDPANDADRDGLCADIDNCPTDANERQLDRDEDGIGDMCDACDFDPTNDPDGDGICNDIDNCPLVSNPELDFAGQQLDRDGDGLGDACDGCIKGGTTDPDRDGVCNDEDLCPTIEDVDQADSDGDGIGDACDVCPLDRLNDIDRDGRCGNEDVCPFKPDPAQDDLDGDGRGDRCDLDRDDDGIPDEPEDADADQIIDFNEDLDGDLVFDPNEDLDGDGHFDLGEDINANGLLDEGEDVDGDGLLDRNEDLDEDGHFDVEEDLNGNGVLDPGEDIDRDGHLDQNEDLDGDSNFDVGEDGDSDGRLELGDNCPNIANSGQENTYGGPRGDACERFYFYSGFEGPPLFGGAVLDNGEGGLRNEGDGTLEGWELSGVWSPELSDWSASGTGPGCRITSADLPLGYTGGLPTNYVMRTGDGVSEPQSEEGFSEEDDLDDNGVRDLANNSNLSLVVISTKAIDLTNARLPRLSFWLKHDLPRNNGLTVEVYVDETLKQAYSVAGNAASAQPQIDRCGFGFYTFDLRQFAGKETVYVRFRLTGNVSEDDGTRLLIDDVTIDEKPGALSIGLPWTESFDSLSSWAAANGRWSVSGPAWRTAWAVFLEGSEATTSGQFVACGEGQANCEFETAGLPAELMLKNLLDLRAVENPKLTLRVRSDGPLGNGQRLSAYINPTNAAPRQLTLLRGTGNGLYERYEASLAEFAGEAEVELSLRFYRAGIEAPGIYVDEMTVEEAPPPPVALFTPTTLVFPNSNVDFVTDGWDFVSDEQGEMLASTTLRELPPSSVAKARFGPFDLTGLRTPTLRIRGRYRIAKDAQSLKIILIPSNNNPDTYEWVGMDTGGENGLLEYVDVNLREYRGDRDFYFEVAVETLEAGGFEGVELASIEILDQDEIASVALFPMDEQFEGADDAFVSLSGDWQVRDGAGRNGGKALVNRPQVGKGSWSKRSEVALSETLDFTRLKRPLLQFDYRSSNAGPGQTLYVDVSVPPFEQGSENGAINRRYRVFQHVDVSNRNHINNSLPAVTGTEGYLPYDLDLSAFAGRSNVKLGFSVEGYEGTAYEVGIDNLKLGERHSLAFQGPETPWAPLHVAATKPYRAYLNGELVLSGEDAGSAEAVRVLPVIGENQLVFEMDFSVADRGWTDRFAASLVMGDIAVRTGESAFVGSQEYFWQEYTDFPAWPELGAGNEGVSEDSEDVAPDGSVLYPHLEANNGFNMGFAYQFRAHSFFSESLAARWVGIQSNVTPKRFYEIRFTLEDQDEDQIPDPVDLCPYEPADSHEDLNGNGIGDMCDPCLDCENLLAGKYATVFADPVNHHGLSAYDPYKALDGETHFERDGEPFHWISHHNSIELAFPFYVESLTLSGSTTSVLRSHRVCVLRWKGVNERIVYSGNRKAGTGALSMVLEDSAEDGAGVVRTDLTLPRYEDAYIDGLAPRTVWHTEVLAEDLSECPVGDTLLLNIGKAQNMDYTGLAEIEIYGAPCPESGCDN